MESRFAPVRDYIKVTPDPAAGSDWALTNDHGERLWVRQVLFKLVTAAAVANRLVALQVTEGQYVFGRYPVATTQVAALTRFYSAFPGSPAGPDNVGAITIAFPHTGLLLNPGAVLASVTDQIQAADQFSQVVVTVYRMAPDYPRNLEPIDGLYQHDYEEGPRGSAIRG